MNAPTASPTSTTIAWPVVLTACAILAITMGVRQTSGLFVSSLNTATGLGVPAIALAMAVGQFLWGVGQAGFGLASDRWGPVPVLWLGGVMMAAGLALTPAMDSVFGFSVAIGVLTAAGAGAGSLSVMIGTVAQRVPAGRRSFASGLVNAGGSFGQFLFAPLTERAIALLGWVRAYQLLAVLALLTLPLALLLRTRRTPESVAPQSVPHAAATPASVPAATDVPAPAIQTAATTQPPATAAAPPATTLRAQLAQAFADRSYWMLHLGFFTCGFHIAFLVTHLPGEIALCGLPSSVSGVSIAIIGLANIAGSIIIGALGSVYRMKWLLFWMYASRAALIAVYLLLPKTQWTFYGFAVGLGMTWLATVPPTAGIVGKLFGLRYMSSLFGLTVFTHQIGGFFGAWLGGVVLERTGDFGPMWAIDIALALLAAVLCMPIREPAVVRRGAPAVPVPAGVAPSGR